MQATPETAKLVVLSGPPCSGKSALAASLGAHTRLSYEEQNKSKHAAKKLTARTLGNSQQVVVDDQNLPAELRATLLGLAQNSAASLHCVPEGGAAQVVWANEWAMAEACCAPLRRAGAAEYLPLAFGEAAGCAPYPEHSRRALAPWLEGDELRRPPAGALDGAAPLQVRRTPLRPALHRTFGAEAVVID